MTDLVDSERVLVLAPLGRDAAVASAILSEAGLLAHICRDLYDLLVELDRGAGTAIITEEPVRRGNSDLKQLAEWIATRPAWSDFPFILLTERGGGLERNPFAKLYADVLGNVSFLERPFHPTTLISVVQTALRGRRRQYDARRRLEELNESEDRLRLALAAGRLGAWEMDIVGFELAASPACKANFGRAEGDSFTYDELLASIHQDDLDRMKAAVAHSIATGSEYDIEYRTVWPDGSLHWVEIRGHVVRDATGKPVRMTGVSADITERKSAEEAARAADLIASEKRFRAIFDTAFQLTWLLDLEGRIVVANHTALQAIGASDAAGTPIWQSSWWSGTPAEAERLRRDIERAARGEFVRYEPELLLPDGSSHIYDFSLKPFTDGSGQITRVIAEGRDVTELKRTTAALLQSQKMEAIGQLTGGVAHDFNNLLMAILGNLDLLRKRLPDDPRVQRLIEGAMQGAKRGASLTQRLLAFARRQELHAESVDAAALIRDIDELLRRSVGPRIEVRLDAPDSLPPAKVDPNQLELAILNLVVNSRDAMPDGGTIDIRVTEARARGLRGDLVPGRYLLICISDNGTGMDPETLKRAIEPFFSTKELGKGTGLGLSMVHGLAVQSGGTLRLTSTPGSGTAAELWLPVATTPAAKPAQNPEARLDAPPSTILVVDDDLLIAMSTVDMLEDLGHTVVEANCGAKALEILQRDLQIDLILTDYAMPGMTGLELAQAARKLRPGVPVLLATGYAELHETSNLDFPRLTKPYQQHQLATHVARLLSPAPQTRMDETRHVAPV
ncbi:MAG TPA: PAS domain S-box protein [Xanthobacteraceae bacterium]